jgi:hypothetical protein
LTTFRLHGVSISWPKQVRGGGTQGGGLGEFFR